MHCVTVRSTNTTYTQVLCLTNGATENARNDIARKDIARPGDRD